MAAQQMSLPGLDLVNDEVALRDIWSSLTRLPGVTKSDFDSKIELKAIRICLARIAEAEMKRVKKCQQN